MIFTAMVLATVVLSGDTALVQEASGDEARRAMSIVDYPELDHLQRAQAICGREINSPSPIPDQLDYIFAQADRPLWHSECGRYASITHREFLLTLGRGGVSRELFALTTDILKAYRGFVVAKPDYPDTFHIDCQLDQYALLGWNLGYLSAYQGPAAARGTQACLSYYPVEITQRAFEAALDDRLAR